MRLKLGGKLGLFSYLMNWLYCLLCLFSFWYSCSLIRLTCCMYLLNCSLALVLSTDRPRLVCDRVGNLFALFVSWLSKLMSLFTISERFGCIWNFCDAWPWFKYLFTLDDEVSGTGDPYYSFDALILDIIRDFLIWLLFIITLILTFFSEPLVTGLL